MDERKKHGWAFWWAVAILLPVLYVASFGPACWITSGPPAAFSAHTTLTDRLMGIYAPLGKFAGDGPRRFYEPLRWWMLLGVRQGNITGVPMGIDGAPLFEISKE